MSIGQVYRDTYFDGKSEKQTHRTIRVVGVDGDKFLTETLTDVLGNKLQKPRKGRVSAKTLASGYVLVSEAA